MCQSLRPVRINLLERNEPFDCGKTVSSLRAFDLSVAGHERACGLPQAGHRRVEW